MSRGHVPPQHHSRPRWQWWIVIVLTGLGLVFGTWGMHEYEKASASTPNPAPFIPWLTSLYHASQMFVLHTPHLDHPSNWKLEIGRWSAAIAFGLTALIALYRVFAAEWQLCGIWFKRDHVIVCGLGRLGLSLAKEFKHSGDAVIAIELRAYAESILHAQEAGIPTLVGNASEPEILQKARAPHARLVLAVCSDDQTNIAIADRLGRLLATMGDQARRPECWIFVADPDMRSTLKQHDIFPALNPVYKVNVAGLDLCEVAARQALKDYPLDHRPVLRGSTTAVHLVIVGFGPMGQALALHAARIGHFATGTAFPGGKKLRVTIIDPKINERWEKFALLYPKFDHICEVDKKEMKPHDPQLIDTLATVCKEEGAQDHVVTFVLCFDQEPDEWNMDGLENQYPPNLVGLPSLPSADTVNFAIGLQLAPHVRNQGAQVLVHLGRQYGYGELLNADNRQPGLYSKLHPIGMIETLANRQTLLHEEQDRIARALHEHYRNNLASARQPGAPVPSRPADVPWENLAETYRNANRWATDHIAIKMRALGYYIAPRAQSKPTISSIEGNDLELLARIEHARWCAERWLAGWEFATIRDDEKKRHPDLLAWEKLPHPEQKIDHALVAAITSALQEAGQAIYRV